MQKCKSCQKNKNPDEFYTSKTPKWCKLCWRKYRQARRDKINIQDTKRRNEMRLKLLEYLSKKQCTDCLENDIMVLQFDHCKGKKTMDVSVMVTGLYSWKRIMQEIDKCEVVCANCHMRRTAKRLNNVRYMFGKAR